MKVKRLLDVLKSAATDCEDHHPDTAQECWEAISELVEMGAEPSYFTDMELSLTDNTSINEGVKMNIIDLIKKHGSTDEEADIVNDLCALILVAGLSNPLSNDRRMLIAMKVLVEGIEAEVSSAAYPLKTRSVHHMLPMGNGVH